MLPEEDMEVETGLFGRSENPDGPTAPKEKASTSRKDIPKVLHDSSKDKVTVFVSNLSYTMAEPEAKLRELFGSCGEVVEIRAVFNNKGTFRGYCYVQFREEEAARQALALDRTAVEGRPMFVSPCVDKNKNPDFKVKFCWFFLYRRSGEWSWWNVLCPGCSNLIDSRCAAINSYLGLSASSVILPHNKIDIIYSGFVEICWSEHFHGGSASEELFLVSICYSIPWLGMLCTRVSCVIRGFLHSGVPAQKNSVFP